MLDEVAFAPGQAKSFAIFDFEEAAAPAPCRTRLLIELAVTRVFGVHHAAIMGATRGRAPVALARQVAMYLAHVACGYNLTRVGDLFGRDRTTVAHACMVVEDRRDDPCFDRALDLLEQSVCALIEPRRGCWPH